MSATFVSSVSDRYLKAEKQDHPSTICGQNIWMLRILLLCKQNRCMNTNQGAATSQTTVYYVEISSQLIEYPTLSRSRTPSWSKQ